MPNWNEIFIISILGGLNVFQFIYWSKVVSELTGKLMSRNLFEYQQATKPVTYQIEKEQKISADEIEESQVLQELNNMIR